MAAGDNLHEHPENTHLLLYLGAFAAFVGLAVWALVAFGHGSGDDAQELAMELADRYSEAGLATVDVDVTTRVLGTSGGAVCQVAPNAAERGLLDMQIVNGATGPGLRPIIATRDLIEGERLVVQVYCPERLARFDEEVADLKLADGQ